MTEREYDCFLVRKRNGKLLKFSYDSEHGIYYQIFMKECWSEKKSIYKDSFEYFYVFDRWNGEVSVFCQDICGDIILCTLEGIEWKYKTLLRMKCDVITPVEIRVFFYCDDIHLLYNIVDKNTYEEVLVHQIAKNGIQWTSPQIISKSDCYSRFSYSIYQEGKSKINIVNTMVAGGYKLISRNFHIIEERWGKEEIIHTSRLPYKDYSFLVDEDRKHYLFVTQDDQINRLIYQYKEIGLQKNTILYEDKNITCCVLILFNEVLWSLWICGNKLYGCFSVNYGKDFSNPKEYRCFDKGIPVKVFYQEYLENKQNNYVINEIYAMNIDGDKQLFLQEVLENSLVTEIEDNRGLKYRLDNTIIEEEELSRNFEKGEMLKRKEKLEAKLESANEELRILKDSMEYEKNQISNLQYKFDKEKEKNKMYINDNYILKEKNSALQQKLVLKEKILIEKKIDEKESLNKQREDLRIRKLSELERLKTKNGNEMSNQVKSSLAKWLFDDENKRDS